MHCTCSFNSECTCSLHYAQQPSWDTGLAASHFAILRACDFVSLLHYPATSEFTAYYELDRLEYYALRYPDYSERGSPSDSTAPTEQQDELRRPQGETQDPAALLRQRFDMVNTSPLTKLGDFSVPRTNYPDTIMGV